MNQSNLIGKTVNASDIVFMTGIHIDTVRAAHKKGRFTGAIGALDAIPVFNWLLNPVTGLNDFQRQTVMYWGEVLSGERDSIPDPYRPLTDTEKRSREQAAIEAAKTPVDRAAESSLEHAKMLEHYNKCVHEIQSATQALETAQDNLKLWEAKLAKANDLETAAREAKETAQQKAQEWLESQQQPTVAPVVHDVEKIVEEISAPKRKRNPLIQ
jgi:hypothetical protein